MSPSLLTFLLFLTSALQLIDSAADTEDPLTGPEGLNVFVRKEGGHIRIYRDLEASKRGKGKTGELTLYVNDIKEYNTRNQTVAKNNVNLNGMTFTTSLEKSALVPFGFPSANVEADCLTCATNLSVGTSGRPSLQLSICAIKQNGTLTLDDERSDVVAGQLKFSLKLSSWPWDQDGVYIEVDVVFKIPPGRGLNKTTREARKPAKFVLGEGAYTEFSSKIYVDGLWKTMPAEYPKDWHNGANHILTLRIPRFNSSAVYDPTVEPGMPASLSSAARGASVSAAGIGLAVMMLIASSKF